MHSGFTAHFLLFFAAHLWTTSIAVEASSLDTLTGVRAERNARVANKSLLQLPISGTSTLSAATYQEDVIKWPVEGTDITLYFSYFGRAIPPDQVSSTINGAQRYITNAVRLYPYTSAGHEFHYSLQGYNAIINVLVDPEKDMSFLGLNEILSGVKSFCASGHNEVLVFDIHNESQIIGFGTLLYPERQSGNAIKARALNATSTTLGLAASPSPTRFLIPGTHDVLVLSSFGNAIPATRFRAALNKIFGDISAMAISIPDSKVPRNQYKYTHRNGVSINVVASNMHQMTWVQLDEIITGLGCFVTGIAPGEELSSHYTTMKFNIFMLEYGYIGSGILAYQEPAPTAAEKRATPVNGSVLGLPGYPNGSSPAPAQGSVLSEQVRIEYPIVNSPITLFFNELGNSKIPLDTIIDFFDGVYENINSSVQARPNGRIDDHLWFFKYRVPIGGATLSISIYTRQTPTLSWRQLLKLLKGLQFFLQTQATTLVFDIELAGNGAVAEGLVWYSPPRPLDDKSEAKRSTTANQPLLLQSNDSTNLHNLSFPASATAASLTVPIWYRIPGTPMALQVYLRGPLIPLLQLEASITCALRSIAVNVTNLPAERIPQNTFTYADDASEVAFAYTGYDIANWLTWQQLSCLLAGILTLVNLEPIYCRQMTVEVNMADRSQPSGYRRYGGLILWYTGDEAGPAEADA